jgi:hypothetical protein
LANADDIEHTERRGGAGAGIASGFQEPHRAMFLSAALGFGVYCLTLNLRSNEWLKIYNAAVKQWLTETISYAEIARRYIMTGIQSFKNVSPDEQSRATHQLQASMTASDTRLRH